MKDVVFLLADVWLIFVGYRYGWQFLRRYGNHLLGLEWLLVATSGVNFLVWATVSGKHSSPLYHLAGMLDAFSRSFGITLILVLGLMAVTHGYKPSRRVEVGVVALGVVAGVSLGHYIDADLHVAPATFYLVTNLLTTAFLMIVARRLLDIGATRTAIETALVTVAAVAIAVSYDFLPIGFDDSDRTYFYTAALIVWGSQGFFYFRAYRALHEHAEAAGAGHAPTPDPARRPTEPDLLGAARA